jgi:CO/xanthine dehydrogenase FAD-binding subunit
VSGVAAFAPADLGALAGVISRASGAVCFVAGGTDLLVAPREPPDDGWIVDISRTRGLSGITADQRELRIGATTTLADLIRSPVIRRHAPVLARTANLCGSAQIRNRATVGGNVANASPAGDLLPILKCFEARFDILTRGGGMAVKDFGELVTGAGRTSLGSGDLITAIHIPLTGRLPHAGFVKLGPRDDLTISRINLTMEADFDAAACQFGEVRLVAGAIGPVPQRLDGVARGLAFQVLTEERFMVFLESLAAAVDAAIPGRASQGYKRRAIMGVGADLLEQVTGLKDPVP